jgi:hypothetical protein
VNDSKLPSQRIEANHRYLASEFDRLKAFLTGVIPPQEVLQSIAQFKSETPGSLAVDRLSEVLGLNSFERDLLLLCAAVELDPSIAGLCAKIQENPRQAQPTFGLALKVLPNPDWKALAPQAPLHHWHLVEWEAGQGPMNAPLRVNERILHFLVGVNHMDVRLQPLLDLRESGSWTVGEHQKLAGRMAVAAEKMENRPVLQLDGDDIPGHEHVAALASRNLGLGLYSIRAEDIPAAPVELKTFSDLWERESRLLPAALLVLCGDSAVSSSVGRFVERLEGVVFVSGRDPIKSRRLVIRLKADKLSASEQKLLWQQALGPDAQSLNGSLDTLTGQFRLSAGNILAAASAALLHRDETSLAGALWDACRESNRSRMEDLAQRIEATAGWEDLVLPAQQTAVLRQIVAQVRHRFTVYEKWGFASKGSRGMGVSALFTGESGTGKTLAAEVLARELNLDLYRIDLSSVVSKYIGETEKNLKRVFDTAEDSGSILLFDEADALFGKRSEVKDSHDRYANIEVGYLLQRMEAYRGLAVLTTNMKSALDKAFQRRIRFIVNFPFPDAAQREAIWSRIFPAGTPTQGLNTKLLAQLNVPGGNIRNIALNAAFMAAEDGVSVTMGHVKKAAQIEGLKMERPLVEVETKGW